MEDCQTIDQIFRILKIRMSKQANTMFNQFFNRFIAVFGKFLCHPVGNDHIQADAPVSHQPAKSINGGAFHFKIGDKMMVVFKTGELINKPGISQFEPEYAALRAKETGTTDSDAFGILF